MKNFIEKQQERNFIFQEELTKVSKKYSPLTLVGVTLFIIAIIFGLLAQNSGLSNDSALLFLFMMIGGIIFTVAGILSQQQKQVSEAWKRAVDKTSYHPKKRK